MVQLSGLNEFWSKQIQELTLLRSHNTIRARDKAMQLIAYEANVFSHFYDSIII